MEAAIEDPFPSVLILAQLSSLVVLYLAYGILFVFLLFLSALISGSEVAFFSFSPVEVVKFQNSKDFTLQRIAKLLSRPKKLLATILILNNLVNISIVTLATLLSWKIAGFHTTEGIVVVTLTFAVTFAIVFLGEVVPKVYANQNNLRFAKYTARLLILAEFTLYPLSWFLMAISNLVERRVERKGYRLSIEELGQALEITTGQETTEEEKGILKSIVTFGTLTVKQIMRSRVDLTAFDIETDFHELMDRINKTGYSRIPVFKENIDKIEGILYVKDLLPYLEQDEDFDWQRLLRPSFFVPESKKIDALFKDFQEKRVHMAIVVDEYGGTSGLITMEDVIEEIVGEIKDEFDEDEIAYNKLDETTFIFDGKTSLNDFAKIANVATNTFDEIKGESESLGGLLLELHSRMPRVGEIIEFNRFVFTTVSVDNKRIRRIRVFLKEPVVKDNVRANED